LYSECFNQIVCWELHWTTSVDQHVDTIAKKNCHLRALRHIRASVTDEVTKMIACSIIGSRTDYCNSLFYGMTDRNLNKLQHVQKRAARIVCGIVSQHIIFFGATSSLALVTQYPCAPGSSLNCQQSTLCFR